MKVTFSRLLLGILIPVLVLMLWEVLVLVEVLPPESIAPPSSAFFKFFEMIFKAEYWRHILVSIYRLMTGFSLGCFLGILLGGVVGYWRLASKILEPTILTLIPVPPMAWIPFFVALLGINDITKIMLISIGAFSTLFIATSAGVRATDNKLLELAKVLNKGENEIVRYIIFPSTLRSILANFRIAMALSWTLLLATEIINASSGIGWLIWDARRFYRSDEMIVGIITIGLLGKLTDYLLTRVSKYYLRWETSFENS